MHKAQMLQEAVRLAQRLGYEIRQDWLGGGSGGACEIRGQKLMFIDLAVDIEDQLEQVVDGLRHDAGIYAVPLSSAMQELLGVRKAA